MADSEKPPTRESRESVRTPLRAKVRFSHPEVGDLKLHTENISDGGAYIRAEGNNMPALGEMVAVQVQGMGEGEAPLVMMRIVRIDKDGMGLEFVDDSSPDGDDDTQ